MLLVAEDPNPPVRRRSRRTHRSAPRWSATATGARTSSATSSSARSSSCAACASRPGAAGELRAAATRASRRSRTSTRSSPTRDRGGLVATPPHTHHALVRRALLRRASTCSSRSRWPRPRAEARDLIDARRGRGRRADARPHVRLQPRGQQGPRADPRRRAGRGLLRHLLAHEPRQVPADGVICDLAPHDLSILLYWLERPGRRSPPPAAASSSTASPRRRS